jgi:hypothetical protein
MTRKSLILGLVGSGLPKGELKAEMFAFHNSMVGKSIYFKKDENPKTACGSCIQRVKCAVWKWYHLDEKAPNYKEIVFMERLGVSNVPLYKFADGIKKK